MLSRWSIFSSTNSKPSSCTGLMINHISPWVLLPNACSNTSMLRYRGSRRKLFRHKMIQDWTATSSCNPGWSSISPRPQISTGSTMILKPFSRKLLRITKMMPMRPLRMLRQPKSSLMKIKKIDFSENLKCSYAFFIWSIN